LKNPKQLKNKPLVEAIFELRWELIQPSISGKNMVDPNYKLLPGRIFDKVSKEYPFHEPLPTSEMPDEIAGYIIQHRFRKSSNGWPLIQLGPGIITLNDTSGYDWYDYRERIHNLLDVFYATHPQASNLKLNGLSLRYIDSIGLDSSQDSIFSFLKNKMKTDVNLNPKLFKSTGVNDMPINIDMSFSFQSVNPPGIIHQRFRKGKKENTEALIWETVINTASDKIPKEMNEIIKWIEDAHSLTDDWFFKTIEGELETRFA